MNLYVELWDKARETDAKRVAQEMKRLRKRAGVDTPKRNGEKSSEKSGLRIEGQEREEEEEEEEEHDIDSDREFIETAAFGVRLLCRYLKKPDEAVTIAKRMQEIRESGKERGLKEDQEVRGKVELALGISLGALAHEGKNALYSRPEQREECLIRCVHHGNIQKQIRKLDLHNTPRHSLISNSPRLSSQRPSTPSTITLTNSSSCVKSLARSKSRKKPSRSRNGTNEDGTCWD